MDHPSIFTIGHSTHPIDYFYSLLANHGINMVIDVRSVAASRFNPQYNKKALQSYLQKVQIEYHHFGEAFGARRTSPDLLNETGQVDFEKVQRTHAFKNGIKQLEDFIVKQFSICLMCSESDPLECHRFSMMSLPLKNAGFRIQHILKDGSLIDQPGLERKLLDRYKGKFPAEDLFSESRDTLSTAFKMMNKEIGYNPASKKNR